MPIEDEKISVIRHSMSHVMAAAIKDLWPEAKFAIGPSIENGFYYDVDLGEIKVSDSDLPKIEEKMREIIKSGMKFERREVEIDEAIEKEKKSGEIYKQELIEDLKKAGPASAEATAGKGETTVSYYKCGEFEDLCRGPHVESSKELPVDGFKLTKLAGAYWRGDEKNKMLTRIYGVAFGSKKELDEYLKMIEEAEKRDHRKLGKELDLFVFSDLVGKGLPLFTPKGTTIWKELEKFIVEEENRRGYLRTHTPDLTRLELYIKSGHWEHYQADMYPVMEVYGDQYVLRPMTCPHQFMIYNSRPRSYRELPLRYAEMAKLYRKEKSGELSGLIRHAGGWTLADAHIICLPEQVELEFEKVVDLIQFVMKTLDITEYWYRFSKWDPQNKKGKYVNDQKAWNDTQASMKKILDIMKLDYVEVDDEAAFYGPKLDVQMKNVNGKDDTAFTVQIDFAMPEKFDMMYIDKDGKEQRPMIIHRSSVGCIERTMAFLIEKHAGAFPLWLSPVQVKIVSVGEAHIDYCRELADEFRYNGIRVEVDDASETVGNKIRKATNEKVPYMLVIGDREMASENLNVRDRGAKETREIGKAEFVEEVKKLIAERK